MPQQTKNRLKRRPRREYINEGYTNKPGIVVWLQRLLMLVMLGLLAVFLLILTEVVHAGIFDEPLPRVSMSDVSQGSLLIRSETPGLYQQVPVLKTEVDMRVAGMIVRAKVKQTFKNPGQEWIEAIYVFPLPENAAVDHLRMHIGKRIIEGRIKEKNAARRVYEKAKREGKKTALVEQQRPNMFTNSVANIGPGETVVVEIEYQQVLRYDQGQFAIRFPMAITPRYIPGKTISENIHVAGNGWATGTKQVPDAAKITPPVHTGGEKNPVSLRIELDVGFPIQEAKSAYHSIRQTRHGVGQLTVNLAEASVAADRDFELRWTPETGQAPKAALFTEKVDGSFYHLLMVLPPKEGLPGGQPMPREVIYVIDTSGSMYGESIEQAKASLLVALKRLRKHDRFNIIQFNTGTDLLFKQAQSASSHNLQRARQYVNGLDANGGTEMTQALKEALDGNRQNDYVRQVIFLTDGSVGNESALFELIKNKLGQSRLYTVGIGSAPNSYFMRKAAKFGRGTFTYIGNVNEVNDKMTALFSKLESPVMSNIQVSFPEDAGAEAWPKRIPDLYQGEPLILAAKTSHAKQKIEIRGMRALAPWQATLDMQHGRAGKGVGVLWARSKIAALMDSLHEGAHKTEVRDEVVNIALTHHLVSRYTSLVAVDVTPSRPQQVKLASRGIPGNLPAGQHYEKVFGHLPQTATSAGLNIITGLMLLLVAWLSHHYGMFNHLLSGNKRVK